MVETNTSGIGIRVGSPAVTNSPSHAISPSSSPHQRSTQLQQHQQTTASAYLTTMLLNSQNCSYLGQRLQNLRNSSDLDQHHQIPPSLGAHQMLPNQHNQQHLSINTLNHNHSSTTAPQTLTTANTSLFTIDSILASSRSPTSASSSSKYIKLESPSTSPTPLSSSGSSPVRPTRVPAMLHPGLHLGHLAAAAAGGFGTPSDFLGRIRY